ncbi:hypothetical protein TUM4445_22980 [Shewanella sp. MBTL60-112-B2]|nr:hypothetical protein TUM4444_37090 [Shewanella sp. MBTL60-112-B1]GIU34405.1 hypothetical protein TUM4445_22980 [Shewanella sp. MBTL60-112-B2]
MFSGSVIAEQKPHSILINQVELGVEQVLPYCPVSVSQLPDSELSKYISHNQLVYAPLFYAITNNEGFPLQLKSYITRDINPYLWAFRIILAIFLIRLMVKLKNRHKKEKSIQSSIRLSEERLKLALWASGDGMWDWNIIENSVFRTNIINPKLFSENNKTLLCIMHPEDKPRVQKQLEAHLSGESRYFEAEYRIKQKDNTWMWLLDRGKVVEFDTKDQPIRMSGTHQDITSRKIVENDLKLSSQVLNSINEAVIVANTDYIITSVNPAFTRITGFSKEEMIGKHFLHLIIGTNCENAQQKVEQQLVQHDHWVGEVSLNSRSKQCILAWLEVNKVFDQQQEHGHFVGVFSDITSRKQSEEKLRLLANFDPLTGLPNRSLFHDNLAEAIRRADIAHQSMAILFIDLDHFKFINDSMGHHIGDQLLKQVSSRLLKAVRSDDTVARLGGDEFTIILENCGQKRTSSEVVANNIINAFKAPFVLDRKLFNVSPSIGVSLYPEDAHNSDDLLKYADTAMYYAKSMGRDNFQFYSQSLNETRSRQLQIEANLKQAIKNNEMSIVYQPKFSLTSRKIIGFEALLRWRSQELGEISPDEFIPIAEDSGSIVPIGQWVLEQACLQLAQWHQQGLTHLTMAVNLSAKQLNNDICSVIEIALGISNLPSRSLELEITESAIMNHPTDSTRALNQMKKLGVILAIDDFGTGYSSLSYLNRFPFDTLKIDREFVSDIDDNSNENKIIIAIIGLAKILNLNVIAEGVENEQQMAFLKQHHCDQVQGYLLSRPLSVESCSRLIFADTPTMVGSL